MNQDELNKILEKHQHWLNEDCIVRMYEASLKR